MFQSDYRREMDRLAPTQAALERGKGPGGGLAGGPPLPWPCAGR